MTTVIRAELKEKSPPHRIRRRLVSNRREKADRELRPISSTWLLQPSHFATQASFSSPAPFSVAIFRVPVCLLTLTDLVGRTLFQTAPSPALKPSRARFFRASRSFFLSASVLCCDLLAFILNSVDFLAIASNLSSDHLIVTGPSHPVRGSCKEQAR